MGESLNMIGSMIKGLGEFLFHLLWLAIAEGLTVEFLRSEIQMIRAKVGEHSEEHLDEHSNEPGSPKTEKFPEYVNTHRLHVLCD